MRFFFSVFFLFYLSCSQAQSFGCFSEPDIIPTRPPLHIFKDEIGFDNLFWAKYELPQNVSDGYHIFRWNKYQPQMEGLVENGKRNGLWKIYFYNKTGYYLGPYTDGRKNGVWKHFDLGEESDTLLLEEFTYKNDSLDGYYYKFINDTIVKSEFKFLNNKLIAYNYFAFNGEAKILWRSFVQNDSILSVEKYYRDDEKNYMYCNRLIIKDKEKSKEVRFDENGDTLKIIVTLKGELPQTIFDKADTLKKPMSENSAKPLLRAAHTNKKDSIQLKNNFARDYYWEDNSNSIHKKVTGKCVFEDGEYLKDSTWNYFINTDLVASVEYKSGKKVGQSKYYDHDGKLRRIEVYEPDGTNYSVFDGDTVNLTDNKGLRQKKWIGFGIDSRFDNFQNCSDQPTQFRYFVNDTLICDSSRVFSYYYDPDFLCENQNCYQKIMRLDSNIYRYNKFCNQKLVEEGDMVWVSNNLEKFGQWKEYDCHKGKLKAEGSYFLDRKIGKWNIYKKNGKVKDVIDYDKRTVRNSNQYKK
jgi:antitoxin component YwqK of YwqJK toxin-antitoxin module